MARRVGAPQLREAGWLHPEGRDTRPLLLVRLEQVIQPPGWELIVDVCVPPQEQTRTRYLDEPSARAALEHVYDFHRDHGDWRIRRPKPFD
ncbi:hypothetical protein [Actinoplanes sp. NPDC049118]|uniref:hypothetical protein n=1 Tax=Actinoplanes sp. NPDC049118 TaxID=3155769 RepID=UPI0033C7E064